MSDITTTDEARWHLLTQVGVPHKHLRALEERLDGDYTVRDYGYAQLSDLADIRLRAVVSDQLLRTVHAVGDNELAACLHRERLDDLVGAGRPLPKGPDATRVLRTSTEVDMALSGFFGALPSALDCLAAVAIGVCRLPLSITKADINHLEPLTPRLHDTGTAAQQRAWSDLAALVQVQRALPPVGWFDWLIAMRNLMTHRARQEHVLLQQTLEDGQPQLAVVTDTPTDVTDTWRFDLHLRTSPSLPDMQEFTRPGALSDLWMKEPAVDTLPALLILVAGLIDSIAEQLLVIWQEAQATPSDFPAPIPKWGLDSEPGASFTGITGAASSFRAAGGLTHGQLTRRLELADCVLRETRHS
jgi:hypothetical protein